MRLRFRQLLFSHKAKQGKAESAKSAATISMNRIVCRFDLGMQTQSSFAFFAGLRASKRRLFFWPPQIVFANEFNSQIKFVCRDSAATFDTFWRRFEALLVCVLVVACKCNANAFAANKATSFRTNKDANACGLAASAKCVEAFANPNSICKTRKCKLNDAFI